MGRTGNVRTVNRNRRSLEHVLAGAAFGALTLGSPAMAADIPLKAPYLRPAFDWSGFYIGGHTGYSRGSSFATLTDPAFTTTSSVVSGLIGGVQAGYNYRLSSGLLFGVEADLTFPNYLPSNHVVAKFATARSDLEERWDYFGTVRGRVGYTSGPWLAYATGGFAWAGERFLNTPTGVDVEEKHINVRPGWAAGAGLEYAFAPHWSVKLEYLYAQFGKARCPLPVRSAVQFNARLPADPHRPQPQGRLAGIEKLDPEVRPDRSRIRPLGNPRPDHLSGTGLSGIPRALYRHQQPDARHGRRRPPGATAFI